jgi:hypothetical protein
MSYSCTNSGCTETNNVETEIDSKKHAYVPVVTAPTCTAAGVESHTCTSCGTVETQSVAATGHTFVQDGLTYTCSVCGDSYTVSDTATGVEMVTNPTASVAYTSNVCSGLTTAFAKS